MLERQLAKLLEGTTDAAFAVDLEGEVRIWNKAAERLFGHTAASAIGKSCAALICGKIPGRTAVCRDTCDILEYARSGKEISNFDMEIMTSSGEPVWVNVSLMTSPGGPGRRPLAIHFMRDIVERKKTEDLTNRVLMSARDLLSGTGEMEAMPPVSPLTTQEKNILRLLASGSTTKEVAAELNISLPTLRNHIYHVNQKLHTKGRIEAVMQASKRKLI